MQGPEDRILLQVTISTVADLDWERIKEDPIWELVSANAPDLETALVKYLKEYTRSYLLFTNMPCTNGPSSILIEKVEVPNVDSDKNAS